MSQDFGPDLKELVAVILFLCADSDQDGWVTVDQVQPEMAKRGYNFSRDQLTTPMGVVAASNDWEIEMTDDGKGIKVRPF